MSFLNENDYSTLITEEIKDIISESDNPDVDPEHKRNQAEKMAISQVKNALSGRYDTDAIFSAVEDQRNDYIIMIIIDCTLYHLYSSVAPNLIPDLRKNRYQDVMDWLKDVRRGNADADLPRYKDESGEDFFDFRISSKYKDENNRW